MTSPLAASGALLSTQQRARGRIVQLVERYPNLPDIRVGQKRVPATYAAGNVRQLNEAFVEVLTDICDAVVKQGNTLRPFSDKELEPFAGRLRDVGTAAFAMLPPAVGEHLRNQEARERRGISVNFTFEEPLAFLWEMMYQGDPFDALDWTEFWGLRFPIGHLFWEIEDPPSSILVREGMFATTHDSLPKSSQEVATLEQHFDLLRQRFEVQIAVQRLERALAADQMNDCQRKLLALFCDEGFRYGVVHFACHCEEPENAAGGDPNVTETYLRLSAHKQEIRVKAGSFLEAYVHKRRFRHHPLVFLNACASGTPLFLLQSFGLPMNLLKFGAGGVIATACSVPDTFASAFAAEFYRRLLDLPRIDDFPTYVGEALLETRLHFLKEYNNPLGLAYGLYTLSDQRLEMRE